MTKIIDKIKRTIQGVAINERGAEICDPKPKFLKTGIKRPPTQEQRLMQILANHQRQMQYDEQYVDETDFDIDEPDMLSPYEKNAHVFDMVYQTPLEDSQEVGAGAGEAEPRPLDDQKEETTPSETG